MPSPLAPDCAAPRWPRAAGALATALCLLFLGVALALHLLRADLHWQQATLSLYLHGPGGLLLRIVYVLLAAAIVALAAGLYAQAPPPARSAAPPLLFAVAALGLCGVAIGDSYLPQRAPLLAPLLHGLFAQTAFLCATVAMLLQSAWLRRQAQWQGHAGTVLALAVAAFVALWVHVLWRAPPRGLTQKLAIVLILAWLLLVAYRLWRPAGLAQSRDNARVSLLQDTAS
ncbi:DUF998 domain-containing protein [Xanthomonas translucens]|uniref:Hypothetical membrane protein n=1 Tax=Xanthomonas translucens pv. translucens DSM 18974 TaxID=1261556 RepID=A0A1C3TQH1_XANCT|nr:DUF998 domain-containing protein [Xanthomonas translucens]MCC8446283.1 DUF998 domain-containing protein [Xanthomonas translucens pv. translucens]MCT8284548.1 DUF998 domain-containing protein [Xanthomonas translucens pv. translucens]MCT8302206.1 DUF998 domain-containing protein [Xanthomonas translucens pv. translucens]QSQ31980.1 DUF998 domain-containing protein [Xanthomonas translucens pv. translucens]UNU00563.1 DUF998 domain-containing protein [Xanthomonas translucens pv. translucens]